MSKTSPPQNDPSDVKPNRQMIANYKDRLSLLVRLDALESPAGSEMEQPYTNQPDRRHAKVAHSSKSHKCTNLLTGLKKRLQIG